MGFPARYIRAVFVAFAIIEGFVRPFYLRGLDGIRPRVRHGESAEFVKPRLGVLGKSFSERSNSGITAAVGEAGISCNVL